MSPRNPENDENGQNQSPSGNTAAISDSTNLNGTRTNNTEHPTDLSAQHTSSSTGIAFGEAASVPHSTANMSNPPSTVEFNGPERNQAYANTSSVPPLNPANDFTGFDLGNTEWDVFMQASGNAGLDPTLYTGDAMSMDPCAGFDIPFWLGQDQYWGMMNERN